LAAGPVPVKKSGGVKKRPEPIAGRIMADALTVVMNTATSRFEATLDGETAFAEYRLHPDKGYVTLPHTIVPPAFEGKGVGSALAKAALGYAREHGLKVKPLCPFIARYITNHPEWQDLVLADFRARLGLPD
jgi:hypothetical protein